MQRPSHLPRYPVLVGVVLAVGVLAVRAGDRAAPSGPPAGLEGARRFWSFRPVIDPPVPTVRNRDRARNPVDHFILARLEAKGLVPASPANKRTLIRRATFDLIGLPPTPAEVEAFLADDAPDAFAKVVDRLLASPHYGERWGRHWLDVARYADTAGDPADFPVPQAYRYRNYVIRSFNRDKPYDQFLREQIAGDLLRDDIVAANKPLPLPPQVRTKAPAEILAEALKDEKAAVRDEAVKALAAVHPKGTAAVAALEGVLKRGSKEAREAAATALMSIDPAAEARLPALAGVLEQKAAVGGKYSNLLRRIKVAKDVGQYSLFQDYGPSEAYADYEGHKNIPKGSWVYAYPYWYIWSKASGKGKAELWHELPGEEKYLVPHSDRIIATGFLAISRRYGIYPEREPHLTIEDTLETLGRSVLGLGLSCARCHDHKFDPIAREDYYGLYGIFSSSRYPTTGSENIEGIPYQRFFVPLVPAAEAEAALGAFQRELSALEVELEAVREKRGDQKKLRAQRDALIARRPVVPNAYAVTEGSPQDAHIHLRGDPWKPGPVVPRRFLQVLGGQELPPGTRGSGRLELAGWLTDPRNPLTARVMVNRIWHHHFGRGLVASPNDFGARGARPTHPELLDWLASRFVESGWSVKAMHRLLMLSATYQLGSGDDLADNVRSDPNNELLWRFGRRRLDAESVRDAMLAVSGELDRSPGGAHPFPAEHQWRYVCAGPFTAVYETDRRSVYLMQTRLRKHPFLELFDGANPSASTGDRRDSTTPVQALYLMNDPFVRRQAEKLADRLLREPSEGQRVRRAYELTLGRPPTHDEVTACEAFLANAREKLKSAGAAAGPPERAAWATLAQVLFSSNEFLFVD